MSNNILSKKIKEAIVDISLDDNSIVVIKGIPITEVASKEEISSIDLEMIVSNKMGYFIGIVNSKRKYITYEEFLLLKDFILSQYSTIYLLNNNIFMEQYPLELFCSDEIKKGLLEHYNDKEETDDEKNLGNIGELVSLFIGMSDHNGCLLGVYSDENIQTHDKIINIDLFSESTFMIEKEVNAVNFIDIVEENDYISFVKHIYSTASPSVCVRISNYTGNVNRLIAHLQIIAENWSDYTDITIFQTSDISREYIHNDEYRAILKKYWGYDSFRELQVYDMNKLENNEKDVINVSQEEIISNIVEQVENCINDSDQNTGTDYRDVFVTAPTGAGKSVMFQIPAIYLAEKHDLLTIVISPLIGLMNDQVKNLELKKYTAAKTINSDISPIIKQEIIEKVANSEYHILYLSPETLLSRSDVEALIGNRTIGMIVIDEAHIVTTWGKQFRPDYWYLGDHIQKLRKKQLETKQKSFIVATFTATAIYGGIEDMYKETLYSLHMLDPITYLGYVKRDDITISISQKVKEKNTRNEYELDKFDHIIELIKRSMLTNKKTLIYFPTVALIERCMDYLISRKMASGVSKYYGTLQKELKTENYELFLSGKKNIMLATKAFGMGIDIDNIEIVAHFAPTGNVCDYVQEIGRAARRSTLEGEAEYMYDSRDFKHINRLHGMSMIQKYQIIEVIKKIEELYCNNIKNFDRNNFTSKRNAMLLDAENFTYIFKSPVSDEDNQINKVKTALLIIQKNFEHNIGFSPITVRPIPLFAFGFFEIAEPIQRKLLKKFPDTCEEIYPTEHICRVHLDKIWNKSYRKMSFAKFKYLLYCNENKEDDFDFKDAYPMNPALCVNIEFCNDHKSSFKTIWDTLHSFVKTKIISGDHVSASEISTYLAEKCKMNKYMAISICEVVLSSMIAYRKNSSKSTTSMITESHASNDGKPKYQFNSAINSYFAWVEKKYQFICNEVKDGELYLVNNGSNHIKEISTVLGILEAMDILSFKMLGGENSQIYIYINQIQSLRNIINNPGSYKNKLLDTVNERHLVSVKMLTYIYESKMTNSEIWDIIGNRQTSPVYKNTRIPCIIESKQVNRPN